jgi:UDP-N-acetylglucosamine transferase subunit ALG13
MTNHKKINIALVCTKGGHFEQMTNLSKFYDQYNHFWITNHNTQTESHLSNERAYYIPMAHFKKPWTYLYQTPSIMKIFARERPTHILSTGSGRTAFIPYLLSRLLNIRFIFIDTFSRVNGYSKFGSFLLKRNNKILTQWIKPQQENAIYIGPVFKMIRNGKNKNVSRHIFVTVGTRDEPFQRLIKGVEELVMKGVMKEKVIVQSGHTNYQSEHLEIHDFCTPKKIEELIMDARYVITQESAGIGTLCLKCQTKFVVMPRDYQFGELPTKSDMNEDLHYKLEELGYTKVVTNTAELETAIADIDKLKTGFDFNNDLALSNLHKIMEEK